MSDAGQAPRIGRGIWRGMYAAIVDHPDFQLLTPHARLTLFVMRIGTQNTPPSIFRYYAGPLQAQTGLSAAELEAALCELEKRPTVRAPWIIRDAQVLWIRNGLRHDPTLSERHEGHRLAILRALNALPNTSTTQKFRRYYNFPRGRGGAIGGDTRGDTGGARGDHKTRSTPKQDKTNPNTNPKGEASPTARPSGGAPSTPSTNNGKDGEGYRVTQAESDRRRAHWRERFIAEGEPRHQADTQAGHRVGGEMEYRRNHGYWPDETPSVGDLERQIRAERPDLTAERMQYWTVMRDADAKAGLPLRPITTPIEVRP